MNTKQENQRPQTSSIILTVLLGWVRGFLVDSVREDGPSSGKVEKNDIILEIGGREVMGIGDILSYLALEKSPREEVSLQILRDGEKITVTIELGIRPSA